MTPPPPFSLDVLDAVVFVAAAIEDVGAGIADEAVVASAAGEIVDTGAAFEILAGIIAGEDVAEAGAVDPFDAGEGVGIAPGIDDRAGGRVRPHHVDAVLQGFVAVILPVVDAVIGSRATVDRIGAVARIDYVVAGAAAIDRRRRRGQSVRCPDRRRRSCRRTGCPSICPMPVMVSVSPKASIAVCAATLVEEMPAIGNAGQLAVRQVDDDAVTAAVPIGAGDN